MNKKIIFVTDFDGTITKKDFFRMAEAQLLSAKDMEPWNDYKAKKISHVEALKRIFAAIRLPQQDMDKCLDSIEVDPAFSDVLDFCAARHIPVYICSAGSKYYIEKRIGDYIKKYNITLLSNEGKYSPEGGLQISAPGPDYEFYSENLGVSKEKLVQSLKNSGTFVIYAGDTAPDFKAAKAADKVFAKDQLFELCKEHGVDAEKFESFTSILQYLRGQYAAG